MRTLQEINTEISRLVEMKNKLFFEPTFYNRVPDELIDDIKILYSVKNLCEQNMTEYEIESCIRSQRNSIIEKLFNFSAEYRNPLNPHYIKISFLRDKLACLNWILEKDQFDDDLDSR